MPSRGVESVPVHVWDRAERVLSRYGLGTLLAISLTIWLVMEISRGVQNINAMLSGHISDSNFYLRALCVNSADTSQKLANCQAPQGTGR